MPYSPPMQVADVYARLQEQVYGRLDGHAMEHAMAESAVTLQQVGSMYPFLSPTFAPHPTSDSLLPFLPAILHPSLSSHLLAESLILCHHL